MRKPAKKSGGGKGYEVGYGRPPTAHRFKPGRSGNPRGRPKAIPDISEVAANELKRRRKITIEGKQILLPTAQILIRRLVNDAALGKIAALREIYEIARPQLQKERSKSYEYKKITESMTPHEAAKAYMDTMAQPNYDDDEPTIVSRRKKRY